MLNYPNNSSFDASVMFRRKHDKRPFVNSHELPLETIKRTDTDVSSISGSMQLPSSPLGGSDNSTSVSGTSGKHNMSDPVGYPGKTACPTESSQLVPKYSGYERTFFMLGSVLNRSTSAQEISYWSNCPLMLIYIFYCFSCCNMFSRGCCSKKELQSRTVWIGRECAQKFPPNVIRNQKYNVLTFFPLVRMGKD